MAKRAKAKTAEVRGASHVVMTSQPGVTADFSEDNIWVFDVRLEKSFSFTDRIRVRGYADFFNITNSHASETISRATGLGYQKPSAILAPRTARVGFRFLW